MNLRYFVDRGWSASGCRRYLDAAERFERFDKDNLDNHVHHVIPRCCGGTDEKANLIKVSPYHHKVLHSLLLKIKGEDSPISSKAYQKLQFAYAQMRRNRAYKNAGTKVNDKNKWKYVSKGEYPKLKDASDGSQYNPLVLCASLQMDSTGKRWFTWFLDRWNPTLNAWEDDGQHFSVHAWQYLPEPPKMKI